MSMGHWWKATDSGKITCCERNVSQKCHCVDYLLAYLLTCSMVHSPSWEANRFAASQEIPRISRNPKVHYRTHKRPLTVTILGQPNPVHIPTSHLLEIHPNIIHPSTPRSPQWSLSLRFPHQDPILLSLLTHTCHMPSPFHCVGYKQKMDWPGIEPGRPRWHFDDWQA